MIDEWGRLWIGVERVGKNREPEYHTLIIDEGTFDKIECEPYEVEVERMEVDTEPGAAPNGFWEFGKDRGPPSVS